MRSPDQRRNSRSTIGLVTVVAAATVLLGWTILHGRTAPPNHHAAPAATVPPAATVLTANGGDVVPLPDGTETTNGYPVAFPHNDAGASAAAVSITWASTGFDYTTSAKIMETYAAADERDTLTTMAHQKVRDLRADVGVPPDGDIPAPASAVYAPLAFKPVKLDDNTYVIWVLTLSHITDTDANVSITMTPIAVAVRWVDEDWRLIQPQQAVLDDLTEQIPPAADPGTPEFAATGWIMIENPQS